MRYEFNLGNGAVRVEECGIRRTGNGAGGLIGAIMIALEKGSQECENDALCLEDLVSTIKHAAKLRLKPGHSVRESVVLVDTNMYAAKTSGALAALLIHMFHAVAISTGATDPFRVVGIHGISGWKPFEEISRERIVIPMPS